MVEIAQFWLTSVLYKQNYQERMHRNNIKGINSTRHLSPFLNKYFQQCSLDYNVEQQDTALPHNLRHICTRQIYCHPTTTITTICPSLICPFSKTQDEQKPFNKLSGSWDTKEPRQSDTSYPVILRKRLVPHPNKYWVKPLRCFFPLIDKISIKRRT